MTDAERYLLGAILADNAQLARVSVSASDFAVTVNAQVFDAARRLIGAGKATDAVTVAELLERETGRRDWLTLTAEMQRDCLAPGNAASYAAVVRRASLTRQSAAIGERLIQGADVQDAIRDLMALSSNDRSHACHVTDAMDAAMDDLVKSQEGALPGVRTGMRDLDEALGGMHDEDLIIVAARPAMGKTAFMLNLACAADGALGVISGEQGRSQVGMRLFAMEGPISLHNMRTGRLGDEEYLRVTRVMNDMKNRSMWIFDKPAPTIEDIVAQARAWKFHNDIKLLMVDYLQKIRGGAGENFRLQVGDITAQLKDLARELKIPVVVLAQAKREVEARNIGQDGMGRMPFMADIAESAIIEQEADQILTLYRPEVYDDDPKYRGIAYVNICKNRHGPIGHKALSWRGEYLKFGDLARTEMAVQDRWSTA